MPPLLKVKQLNVITINYTTKLQVILKEVQLQCYL